MNCRLPEPSVVFLVSPPIVRFTDYKVGQVYEVSVIPLGFSKNYRDVFLYNSNFKSFYSGFELFNCNSVVWGRLEFCYI